MEYHSVKYGRKVYRGEYLQSEEWKAIRERILRKCGGLCEMCGGQAWDVHHMDYRILGVPGFGTRDFLIGLCRECHDLVEEAVKLKVIPSPHRREHLKLVTKESVKAKRKEVRGKNTWDKWMTWICRSAQGWKRTAICAAMKMEDPGDFAKWEGKKLPFELRKRIQVICGHRGPRYRPEERNPAEWRLKDRGGYGGTSFRNWMRKKAK